MTFTVKYGKSGASAIQLLRVLNKGNRQDVRDLTVRLMLKGDFEPDPARGPGLLPAGAGAIADRVYALAHEHGADQIESFALVIAQYLLRFHASVHQAEVAIAERVWTHVMVAGRPHDRAFTATGEKRLARVVRTSDLTRVEAGFRDLPILRVVPDPGVAGALLLGTLSARWRYGWSDVPFHLHWQQVRQVVLETFANHLDSSVPGLLQNMAQSALEQTPSIAQMRFILKCQSYEPAELTRSGMENAQDLLVPTGPPYRTIETSVVREE